MPAAMPPDRTPAATDGAAPKPPYRVVGYVEGGFGLAVAARNTLAVLARSGRQATTFDFARPPELPAGGAPGGRHGHTNVFHANPLEIAGHRRSWRRVVRRTDRNVCVPFWELPVLPTSWRILLSRMDAILAPTRFVQATCAEALPGTPVLHYPQAVFLPPGVRPDPAAFGLGGGATTFLLSFDIGSDIARKNPEAALAAFQAAFPGDEAVRLVVKTKPWPEVPAFVEAARALRQRVQGDRRIQIVERDLDYPALLGLYASCDVLLALHRSEGLGLHLMEAMSLGKPVVATGWSGNMDFMTPANSVPLGHRLVPVATAHGAYLDEVGRPGQVWAEADQGEAVEALRALHRNAERRRALGAVAAADMEARREEALRGGTFDALERRLRAGPRPFLPRLRLGAWLTRREMRRRDAARAGQA